jgi:hypothetical protein
LANRRIYGLHRFHVASDQISAHTGALHVRRLSAK